MKQLECTITANGHAQVVAYAIDRSQRTISSTDDKFILWANCPDENSTEAKAVMAAARKLSDPTDRNKMALIGALIKHTGTDQPTATNLTQAIIDGVEAAKQRARDKQ